MNIASRLFSLLLLVAGWFAGSEIAACVKSPPEEDCAPLWLASLPGRV